MPRIKRLFSVTDLTSELIDTIAKMTGGSFSSVVDAGVERLAAELGIGEERCPQCYRLIYPDPNRPGAGYCGQCDEPVRFSGSAR